jgi:NIMA (never in mitosis gene a)-related kinase
MSKFSQNNNKKYIKNIPRELYTQKKLLGEGSFGKVFLIESINTHLEYACKDIDLSCLTKEEEKLAINEVTILKNCNHPNIISFKEAFITRKPERALHLITEYIDNGDLGKKKSQQKKINKPFEEEILINWLIQICLALKYLHNNNIIHRDIKPSNIMLTKNNIIKIGDFGISKALSKSCKKAKTFIGTPPYMAPEVINSEKYDYPADIWSLGITFFELMTFNVPFEGNSDMGLFKNIIEGNRFLRISNNSFYSLELINIVKKMISNNPKERPKIDEILDVPIIKKNLEIFLENNKELYNNIDFHLIKKKNYNNNSKNIENINNKNLNGKGDPMLTNISENEESEEKDYSKLLVEEKEIKTSTFSEFGETNYQTK